MATRSNIDISETIKKYSSSTRGLPSLVVIDLDYTLWPYFWYVRMQINIKAISKLKSFSDCRSANEIPEVYPHALEILRGLHKSGVTLAIASRTITPKLASSFLDTLGISDLFISKVFFEFF